MRGVLLVLASSALIFLLLRVFLTMPPARLARLLRSGAGVLVLALASFLMMRGQFALALMLAVTGFMMLMRRGWGGGQSTAGQTSEVRSAGLEMKLDHDSGDMDGRVLAGRFEGSLLSQLKLDDLMKVAQDFRDDAESLRLLESYLERAHPGWREDFDNRTSDGAGPAQRPGGMSAQEAYEILGLKPGAGEAEISAAHRRLMKQVHPDRGGSDALAAKINEAKDLLLGKHH